MSHPHVVDPPSGQIVNWNNKPAAAFAAADDNWSYGSVHRVDLLNANVGTKKHTPASVVSAMNAAATKDLRQTLVPLLVPRSARPPSAAGAAAARAAAELERQPARRERRRQDRRPRRGDHGRLVAEARGRGSPAGAREPHGRPQAARLDLERRELERQLVRLRLVLVRRQGPPLGARRLGGEPVLGEVLRPGRSLAACAASVWQSLDAAGAELAAAQGADPSRLARRRDEGADPLLRASSRTRCAGRTGPTFQQVVVFRSHR